MAGHRRDVSLPTLKTLFQPGTNLVQDRCGDAANQLTDGQCRGLASDFNLAFDSGGLPQPAPAMGIHVDPLVCHLSQPEVVDVLADAIPHCSPRLALGSLSSG